MERRTVLKGMAASLAATAVPEVAQALSPLDANGNPPYTTLAAFIQEQLKVVEPLIKEAAPFVLDPHQYIAYLTRVALLKDERVPREIPLIKEDNGRYSMAVKDETFTLVTFLDYEAWKKTRPMTIETVKRMRLGPESFRIYRETIPV